MLTTLVDNIEHIESTTYNGSAIIKIFLQPHTGADRANSQVVAASQFVLRFLPPGQPSHRTAVPNVFLVGAGTWPGNGVNGGFGYIVAHQLLKPVA